MTVARNACYTARRTARTGYRLISAHHELQTATARPIAKFPDRRCAVLFGQNAEQFGDIVYRPTDRRENYVKRCVGLPGQTLQIKNNVIYLDGKPNREPENVQYAYEVTFVPGNSRRTETRMGHHERGPLRFAKRQCGVDAADQCCEKTA